MSNQFIEVAQAKLKQAGFYTDDIDGIFGEESLKAVQKSLTKAGCKQDVPAPTVKPVQSNAPAWIIEALKHLGVKEIVGPKHSPTILGWVKNLGGWFTDDETPWCGTFIAQCLKETGRGYPKHWYRALAYGEGYGTQLKKPAYGCIGVMARTGGGHVTFIVGKTQDGKYLVGLGGNQSNAVNLMKFPIARFTAFTWPTYDSGVASTPYPDRYNLPTYDNSLKVSTNEA